MNHPATSTPARASATPAETNGVDASDAAALARIHAAIHALQRMTEVFQRRRAQLAASVGITEREWRVLDGICSEDFMPSMFARRRESTPAAVSKILRQLIDKRLVDVTVSKADGRQRDYALTAKGHRTMLRLREQREQRLGTLEYGVFLERQWTAGDSGVSNTFSLARAISGRRFARNIPAEPGSYAGVNGSLSRMLVQHPGGLRITGILRAEAATGTFQYATASVESSISENLGRVRASLTGSAGNSFGRVPVQRSYMLGGLRTVRGEPPAAQSGDAFWFTRAELGTRQGVFRPVVFYDVGWAGSRSAFSRGGSLRGAGAGVSLLDGLLRFDVSRGLGPFKTWRSDFYLEAPI